MDHTVRQHIQSMKEAIEAARLDLEANEAFLRRALAGVGSNNPSRSQHSSARGEEISVQTDTVRLVAPSHSVECQTSDETARGVERQHPSFQTSTLSLPPLLQKRTKAGLDEGSIIASKSSSDRFGQSVERNRHLAFQMDERAPGLMLLRRILEQKEEGASRAARLERNQPNRLAEAESRLMFKPVARLPVAEHGSYIFSPGRLRDQGRSSSTTPARGKVAAHDVTGLPKSSGTIGGKSPEKRQSYVARGAPVSKLRPLPGIRRKHFPAAAVQVIVLDEVVPAPTVEVLGPGLPESVGLEKPKQKPTISVVSKSVTLIQAQLRHRLSVRIAQTLQPHLSMIEKRLPVLQAHLRRMKVGLTLRQVSLLVQLQAWTRCRLSRDGAVRRQDYAYFKGFALLHRLIQAKLSASLVHRMRFRPAKPFVNLRVPTLVAVFALRCGKGVFSRRPRPAIPQQAQTSCMRCRPFLELMYLQRISKKPRAKSWTLLCSDCQPQHSKYKVKS